MNMRKMLLALLASVFAANLSAAELSFNNLGLTYHQLDFDCDTNCDGFGVQGSVQFNDMFMAGIDHSNFEGDVDLTYLTLGLKHNFSDAGAVYGQVGAARVGVDAGSFGSASETKGVVGVGIRGIAGESFETDFLIRKVFASGSDPTARLTGTYFFSDTVGASVFVDGGDGYFGGGLGLRLNY
jgi:hypothetical protein